MKFLFLLTIASIKNCTLPFNYILTWLREWLPIGIEFSEKGKSPIMW